MIQILTPRRWICNAASLIVAEQNFGGTLKTLRCPQPSTFNVMLWSLPESAPKILSSAITMFRQVVINDYTQQQLITCYVIKTITRSILWHISRYTGVPGWADATQPSLDEHYFDSPSDQHPPSCSTQCTLHAYTKLSQWTINHYNTIQYSFIKTTIDKTQLAVRGTM